VHRGGVIVIAYAFHPLAESELRDAAHYYEDRRKGLGTDFLGAVRACIKQIRTHPHIGTLVAEQVRRRTIKRFPYNLIYLHEDKQITILAVMHQMRRPGYWRDRMYG
jgi:plasmid stabilization system protein ParE